MSNQHAIAAWAHAQAGNMQEVHRETGLAEELFATADRSSVPDWRHRTSSRLSCTASLAPGTRHWRVMTAVTLERRSRRLTAALELRGAGGARNATLDRISLAEAHLLDRDLDQALNASGQALFLAEHSASRRIRKRLSDLHGQLGAQRVNSGASEAMRTRSASC